MSRLLDDEQDDLPERERELTLSTGAILAIFLGLVLLCAVFFGFGYNLGRKSTTVPNAAAACCERMTRSLRVRKLNLRQLQALAEFTFSVSSTVPRRHRPPRQTTAVSTTAPANATETQHAAVPVHATPAPTPLRPPSASPPTPARASQLPRQLLLAGPSLCRSQRSRDRTRTMRTC